MEKYSELSHKQTLIYEFICEYLDENGISPTIEDVKIGCNISSKSVVSYNLDILEKKDKQGSLLQAIQLYHTLKAGQKQKFFRMFVYNKYIWHYR